MKRHTKIRGVTRYLPLPWDRSSFTSAVLLMVSVVLITTSSLRPNSFKGMRTVISDIFQPALSIVSLPFQRTSIFLHDITSLAQLQADKARLEQENERLREWYQTALLLESENKSLRDLLNLKVDPQHRHISTRVIADSGNAYVKSVLVESGKEENVHKGDAVLSGGGLIGRVVESGVKTARVLLITDINSRVPVVVEDSGLHAIMAGANNSNPQLIHLPEDSEIRPGTRLVTSGYGGVFPKGIPVGRVKENNQDTLGVMLFADFGSLQVVRIIQTQKQGE